METINGVRYKLLALSMLDEELTAKLKQEWGKRFSEREAFWVEVQPAEKTKLDMERRVDQAATDFTDLIMQRRIENLNEVKIITAIFVDMTKEPTPEDLKLLVSIPERLSALLHCDIPLTLEFAWMGRMISARERPVLRSNIRTLVRINMEKPKTRKQCCMVARSAIGREDKDTSWKAVMTFLEVLRRMRDPETKIPSVGKVVNDDVGFLRYAEFDQARTLELAKRLEKLTKQLGDGGADRLREILADKLETFRTDAQRRLQIDPRMQPLHPDMYVGESFLNCDRRRARKGQNAKFNAAQYRTLDALEASGKQLERSVQRISEELYPVAEDLLEKIFEEAQLGIDLESNKDLMEQYLDPGEMLLGKVDLPALSYSETGYDSEIRTYLEGVLSAAIEREAWSLKKRLRDAYQGKNQEQYQEKRERLLEEQRECLRDLGELLSQEKLLELIRGDIALPNTCFFAVERGGDQLRILVTRDETIESQVDAACAAGNAYGYFIDKKLGGLRRIDGAPTKALELFLDNCALEEPKEGERKDRLCELIPDM